MTAPYAYQPLDASLKEIRTLVLYPTSAGEDETPQCELQVVSLAEDPATEFLPPIYWPVESYETISYCWGDPLDRSQIYIASNVLAVPRSAELALRRLRLSDKSRLFWIDAVCINQNDIEERSQQVAIMTEVYRKATQNIVYLGEPDDDTESAIRSIETVMTADITPAIGKGKSLVKLGLAYRKPSPNIDQIALASFYSRPWFRRLWVVQEIAMAKSSIGMCGSHTVDMLDVLKVANWFRYKAYQATSNLQEATYFASRIHMFFDKLSGAYSLGRVMNLTRGFEYSEPLDVVYAVTGLVDWDKLRSDKQLPSILRPDYYRSLSELLTDATRVSVSSQETLRLFNYVFHRSAVDMHLDGLPSWVPKWHRKRDRDKDVVSLSYTFDASANCGRWTQITDEVSNAQPANQLNVAGFCLDTITEAYPPCKHFSWTSLNEHYIQPAQDYRSKVYPLVVSICHVLTGGGWHGQAIDDKQIEQCEDICDNFKISDRFELDEVSAGVYTAMYGACRMRMLCTTSRNLLCLVPDLAQVGDILAILFRGDAPFVLRPVGEFYQLIGACYVAGMMHGEAVKEWKAKGGAEQIFSLI